MYKGNLIAVVLLSASFLLSCSPPKTKNHDSSNPISIKIEGGKFESIPLGEFFDNSSFVFLESSEECNFDELSSFLPTNKEFFVVDMNKKDIVFRFDADGKFLNTIGQTGGGPGEYIGLADALLNGDTIEILTENASAEVYKYTKAGRYLSKETYSPKYIVSFEKDSETKDYLLYSSFGDNKVWRLDNSGAILDSLLPQKQEDRVGMTLDAFTKTIDGEILLNETIYNIIWAWDGENFVEKYSLDFGEYTFTQGEKDEERYFADYSKTGHWAIRWYTANTDFLYVLAVFIPAGSLVESDAVFKHLVYSNKTNKTYELGDGDINMRFRFPLGITKDNQLYLSGSPVEMADWQPWLKIVEEKNLPFDIEGNPIIFIVDLEKLI